MNVNSIHADTVGSLLRPPELLDARRRLRDGEIEAPEFKEVEDRAVDDVLRMQEEVGLDIVNDGELRRLSFQSQMTEAVAGFGEWDLDAFLWGEWHSEDMGDLDVKRPSIAVAEPLRRRRSLCTEEFTYMRGRTDRTVKVTIPSPSLFANFWDPERSTAAYSSAEEFIGATAEILREDVDELVSLGCTYIQLDAPHYTLLIDPAYRQFYAERGWSADKWLDFGLEFDNLVIGDRPGVTFAFHLCRGNQRNRWLVEGGYDTIAPQVFKKVRAERLMLEYDDVRSGSFEPLRGLPEDKIAVLGLLSTKKQECEAVEDLQRRINEASRFCSLERLALSPQCGFATSIEGNDLSVGDQRAKLRRLVETAREVWSHG